MARYGRRRPLDAAGRQESTHQREPERANSMRCTLIDTSTKSVSPAVGRHLASASPTGLNHGSCPARQCGRSRRFGVDRDPHRRPWVAAAAFVLFGLAGAGSAAAAEASVSGGAYGLSANVNALVAPVSVGPLPSVSLPAEGGGPFTASLLSADVLGLASVGVAEVSTEGNSGVGSAASSASLVDVNVAGLVQASVGRSRCSATADGAEGSASVVDLVVAGIPISTVNLGPNTTISLPVGRVVINEQRRDGATGLTVNAVHVTLNAVAVSGDLVLAQSRCAVNPA